LIISRVPSLEGGKSLPILLLKVNLNTHQVSEIPGSNDMTTPTLSTDGRFLAALHTAAHQIAVYEFATGKWTMSDQHSVYRPAWAPNSDVVYFIAFIARGGELYRYDASRRQVKLAAKISSSAAINGNLEALGFLLIGPDGAPLFVRDQRSSQLYALEWQKP